MNNQNNQSTPPSNSNTVSVPASPTNAATTSTGNTTPSPILVELRTAFNASVLTATVNTDETSVRGRVVAGLVAAEVTDRASVISTLLQRRETAVSNLNKINRADVETFDADGKVSGTSWTKKRVQEVAAAKAVIAKIDAAVEKAFSATPDFGPARALANQKDASAAAPAAE